jgi:uncharacterized protein (TIGR02466 family)
VNYTTHTFFPTLAAVFNIDINTEQVNSFFEENKLFNLESDTQKVYGDRSLNTYILDDYRCKELSQYILKCVDIFSKNILQYKCEDYIFLQSWVSVKYPLQKHTEHYHSNSIISGVYYWQKEDIEPICFYREKQLHEHNVLSVQQVQDTVYTIKPQPNTIVLFPSYLKHSVQTNTTLVPRKSVAFNLIPLTGLGNNNMLNEINFKRITQRNIDIRLN